MGTSFSYRTNKWQPTEMMIYFLIPVCYSFLVYSGFYGWKADYFVYMNNPNFIWRPSEFLGGSVATLTICGVYLGGGISSFILAFSILIFNRSYFQSISYKYSIVYICMISIFFLHMWPVIIASTNALRQAVAFSFIMFLASYSIGFKSKSFLIVATVAAMASFSHKMGMFYAPIICLSMLLVKFKKRQLNGYLAVKSLLLFVALSIFASIFVLKYYGIVSSDHVRSTGFDMSYPLFIFIFMLVCLYLYKWNHFKNENLLVLRSSVILLFFATAPYVNQSLVYERLVWPLFIFSLLELITISKLFNFKYTLFMTSLILSAVSVARFVIYENQLQ
jgi:hypothetical protein